MNKLSQTLGLFVTLSGLLVMIGWISDIAILKSILPIWVTMKFSTALTFFAAGISLYCIAISQKADVNSAPAALSISTLVILLFMATLLFSTIFSVKTGIEDLFVKEATGAIKTTVPGKPSVGTMLSFILIGLAGILVTLNSHGLTRWLQITGSAITTMGTLALLGYIINEPLLYYTLEGWSTAMAVHTAILFVILGGGLILASHNESSEQI